MLDKNCNFLTSTAISVLISFIFTLLFYIGIITNTLAIFIFSLILSLLSLLLIGFFNISDNGLTRQRLCQNCLSLIVSIVGNTLFSLLALTISLTARNITSAILVCLGTFFFLFNFINLIIMLISASKYT